MKKYNRNQSIDNNIVIALKDLPKTIVNNCGNKVYIRKVATRNESGIEHISNITHGLQVKDIKLIPTILKNPYYVCIDPIHRHRKNYYYKKYYKNQFKCFVKIVTAIQEEDNNLEEIITIYLTNKIKM